MTGNDEQAELHAALEATIGAYIEFMMEHGIDPYHQEPPVNADNYIAWFILNPPDYLRTADDDRIFATAVESWEAAMSAQVLRDSATVCTRLRLTSLAAHRIMLNEVSRELVGGEVIVQIEQAERLNIIRALWLENCWSGPWQMLVDQEFPGPEPTASEVAAFEADRSAWELHTEAMLEKLSRLRTAFGVALFDHGLIMTLKASLTVAYLVNAYEVACVRRTRSDTWRATTRTNLWQIIEAEADDPDHPAWTALLEVYLELT